VKVTDKLNGNYMRFASLVLIGGFKEKKTGGFNGNPVMLRQAPVSISFRRGEQHDRLYGSCRPSSNWPLQEILQSSLHQWSYALAGRETMKA
jgi:hypothetical protein